jgi:cholesterol transport system auxiliary component
MSHVCRSGGVGWTPWARVVAVLWVAMTTGCSALLPTPPPPTTFYALEALPLALLVPTSPSTVNSRPSRRLTWLVSPMLAAPGFDTPRIVYVREPHRRESFALSEWVDTPARMLVPLLVAALAADDAQRWVVSASGPVSADVRLDTLLVRLQQNFSGSAPSRVRITLRATLVDARTSRVVAWREFDAEHPAASQDARGGVAAAQLAVHSVLTELRKFCKEAADTWVPCAAEPRNSALHHSCAN